MRNKPRAVIIGLGQYFRKIKRGIYETFKVIYTCDNNISKTNWRKLKKIFNKADCFFILTPPDSHLFYIRLLYKMHKVIFVEKPLVLNESEVKEIRKMIKSGAKIYCSDIYLNIRAEHFLHTHKQLIKNYNLGKLLGVTGFLNESNTFDHSYNSRPWLWNQKIGGVVSDLMYHYLIIIIKYFGKNLKKITIEELSLKYLRKRKSETSAKLTGNINNEIKLKLNVSKFCKKNVRYLKFIFENGYIKIIFNKKNSIIVKGKICVEIKHSNIDYYKAVGSHFLSFLMYNKRDDNIYESINTVLLINFIKKHDFITTDHRRIPFQDFSHSTKP